MLFAYLVVREMATPGFTRYWGYLVTQVGICLVVLLAGEMLFGREGGFSWPTHVLVAAGCYADVLGNDGGLYAVIDEYDKITHFIGVGAVTAALFDAIRILSLRGYMTATLQQRLVLAVLLGVAFGMAWEVYEFVGDDIFNTARWRGPWDTANDMLSNTLGALTVATVLWFGETRRPSTRSNSELEAAMNEVPTRELQ